MKFKDLEPKYQISLIISVLLFLFLFSYLYAIPPSDIFNFLVTIFALVIINDEIIPIIKEKVREEPSRAAFEFVRKWWKEDMKTGEDISVEESKCFEGYWENERIYGFSVKRTGTEKKILICCGTSPKRIIVWDEVPDETNKHPFELLKEVYGVRPLPHPKISTEKYIDFKGVRRIKTDEKEKSKKKKEDEDE